MKLHKLGKRDDLRAWRAGNSALPPTPERPESPVGNLLRASRLRCGEELAGVAQALRIRRGYLEALEDGKFNELPGATYAVGFVRTYAEHLGLDGEEVVRRFRAEASGINRSNELVFPSPATEGGVPGGALMLVGVVLAALAYGGWFVLSTRDQTVADLVPNLPERLAGLIDDVRGAWPRSPAEPQPAPPDGTQAATPLQIPAAPATTPEPPAGAASPPAEAPRPASRDAATSPPVASIPAPTIPAPPPIAAVSEPPTAPPPAPPAAAVPPAAAPTVSESPVSIARAEAAAPPVARTPAVEPARPQPPAAETRAVTPPPAPAASAPPSAPPAIPNAAVDPADLQVAALPEGGETPASGSAASGSGHRIVVRARIDSWIQVRDEAENQLLLTRLMRAGDTYDVPNRSGLKLLTGNAGALDILVDGEMTPSLGPIGAVRRDISLNAELLRAGTAARP